VVYSLPSCKVAGVRICAIRFPEGSGSVLIGERLLPASVEALVMLTAGTNDLARLNRELHKRYLVAEREKRRLDLSRQRLEKDLEDRETRLGRIFDASYDPIALSDLETGVFLDVSQAFERATGYRREEALGRTILDLLGADPGQRRRMVEKVRLKGYLEHFPLVLHRKDGQAFLAEMNLVLIDHEGRPCIVSVCRDVTEQVRTRETLNATEAMLGKVMTAVTQTPHSLMVTDRDGLIEFANPACCLLSGRTLGELLGAPAPFLRRGEESEAVFLQRQACLQGGEKWAGRTLRRRPDGTPWWVSATVAPVRDPAGELTGFVAMEEDITEAVVAQEQQRSLERQLAQVQKLESLGSLAGGLAHDMNNVLGAIQALAQVHLSLAAPDSPLARGLETITKACERGGKLVKGLLGFSRSQLEEEHVLDLNALVAEQVALLEHTTFRRVRLQLNLEEGLHPIKGDPAALSHALMNVCVNAVDAMPEGGTLTLGTRNDGAAGILLEVEDTGSGMPPEVLDRVLDPFFTTKPRGKGTGLGLAIVYGTVKAHGGLLDLESEVGRGTRVRIRLPACGAEAPDQGVPPAEASGPTRLRMLVVDDDELLQAAWVQVLGILGHGAVLVSSGEEALARLGQDRVFDGVILDWNMPGLGGAGTLPRLRALCPDLPVVICSGGAQPGLQRLLAADANLHQLAKPFTIPDMEAMFQRILP
jgi:PAS domain S-box-containing protein